MEERLRLIEEAIEANNQKLADIERTLSILESLFRGEKPKDKPSYVGKRFVVIENIYYDTDKPIVNQGRVFKVDSNNRISISDENMTYIFKAEKFVELYGDKIRWLYE